MIGLSGYIGNDETDILSIYTVPQSPSDGYGSQLVLLLFKFVSDFAIHTFKVNGPDVPPHHFSLEGQATRACEHL